MLELQMKIYPDCDNKHLLGGSLAVNTARLHYEQGRLLVFPLTCLVLTYRTVLASRSDTDPASAY
jgi:hypothetical protein